jgi:hypothetical protein
MVLMIRKLVARVLGAIAIAIDPTAPAPETGTPPQPNGESNPSDAGNLDRKAQGFISFGANLMRMHPSAFDIQLMFGELAYYPANKVGALWSAAVTMSWQQSKLLTLFLALHLQVYEKENGCVEICKSVFPDFVPGVAARLPVDRMLDLALRAGTVAPPAPSDQLIH